MPAIYTTVAVVRMFLVADDGGNESQAASNESEAPPEKRSGCQRALYHRRWRERDGVASARRRPAACTLHRMVGQPETHIRCQDGPSNLVQCDADDTMRHQQRSGEPWNAGQYQAEQFCKALMNNGGAMVWWWRWRWRWASSGIRGHVVFTQVWCGVVWLWCGKGHRSQQKFVSSRKSCQRIKTCILCAVGTLGSVCVVTLACSKHLPGFEGHLCTLLYVLGRAMWCSLLRGSQLSMPCMRFAQCQPIHQGGI